MGNAVWSADTYSARSTSYRGKSRAELFQRRSIRKDFDPANITIRESCDSEANPESTALIFGLDVSGSMGFIAEQIAKEDLGTLVSGILDSKPVTDPHLMMMALGDIFYDNYPLQVTQFEADIRIADQLIELYLEGNGGGNSFESYDLAWAFAATKTKIDCFDKRGKKGYLFTIGDELPPTSADRNTLKNRVNLDFQSDPTAESLLNNAKERYNVFHLIVEEGSFVRGRGRGGINAVHNAWSDVLGRKAILLDDHTKLSAVVISVIQVNEGMDPEDAVSQWQDEATRSSVRRAIYGPSGQ